jgi:DNA-binding CsgD family transcriptional regulator
MSGLDEEKEVALMGWGAMHHVLDSRLRYFGPNCVAAEILEQADATWQSGDIRRGIAYAEEAALACDQCFGRCSIYGKLQCAYYLSCVRRIDAARKVMGQISVTPVGRDGPEIAAITLLLNAHIALNAGELSHAAAQSESGLHLAGEADMVAWIPLGNLVMATTALRRGELSTTLHYADRLKEDSIFGRKMLPVAQSAWVIAQITETERGREQAAGLARELLDSESAIRSLLASDPAAVPGLVRLMVSVGQANVAGQGVSLAISFATANADVGSVRAAALHAAGLLEVNAPKLRHAAEDHVDPWARASAYEDLGITLGRDRQQHEEAAESFQLAMLSYEAMGAHRDLSRVRNRLRSIGRKASTVKGFWPRSRIPCLTDTEYAVAKLVSNGLTNEEAGRQMFLSRHTVAFHLRKVFQKLGLKSRLELAIMWNELDSRDIATQCGLSPSFCALIPGRRLPGTRAGMV